ncbi:Rib/alpha-like domain-containing protein [Arcanobacterium phocae]|uniref:Rib/alpha-like domain-containing protein n=1 Tax=Arcanobacterium phocae TaxID=131112 RepID=UPI001C0F23F5|nr:Rib/alpha-like domain-containing protein [Arcanobacterium phocae]
MGTKYNITSIILLTGLLLGTSPPAFAANNVEVGFTTTLAELKAAVSDPATQSVTFTADNSFNGGLVIDHPMTFTINDGVDVTFDGSSVADKTGLDIASEFTLINNGNLIIEDFAGYGMKINQKVPGQEVTVRGDGTDGSSIHIGPTRGYGINGQLIRGPFTVSDTSLTVSPGPDTAEGPIIFARNGGTDTEATATFDNSTVTIDHSSKTSVWRAAFYSERPVIFRNSIVHSTTVRNYNMSFVAGAAVDFSDSTVTLVTTPDAISSGFFAKPFVSLNTANNSVGITNSTITSEIAAPGTHQAFQFQDAAYTIDNSTVIGDSLGVDYKQKVGSHLTIVGDSRVDIPGTSMPNNKITTVIDGGTVDLPAGAVAKNSLGQDLHEFISGADSTSVTVNCETRQYTYPVTHTSADQHKHVWAPAVNVDYYASKTDPNYTEHRLLIAGTSTVEPLNEAEFFTSPEVPAGLTGKFVAFDPESMPGTEFTPDSTVCTDTKVTFNLSALLITPIPDVATTDLTIRVGDTVPATDGLVDLPAGAQVEIITPAQTSAAGKTTQTVKITFDDGSTRIKVINVNVIDQPTPADPIVIETPMLSDSSSDLAKTGFSLGFAGLVSGILLASGTGIMLVVKRRRRV